jgi:hypothetical protein
MGEGNMSKFESWIGEIQSRGEFFVQSMCTFEE